MVSDLSRWFRKYRLIAIACMLIAMSFVVFHKLCVSPSAASGVAPAASMPIMLDDACLPHGCTSMHSSEMAAIDEAFLLQAPLLLAFAAILLHFLAIEFPIWQRPPPRRGPVYPPILEFYRLRI